jgi:DNA adenine methylase
LKRNNNLQNLKPPLKWAGGKRWLVPHLMPLWEPYSRQRLVEPFCGGLAVTLGLMPERALLNDINAYLINFFQWVQKGLTVKLPLQNEKDLYYSYREQFNNLIRVGRGNSREAAEFFYYLNKTGFNGLCRFNRKDEFNVPFGRYKKINYNRDFEPYREVFRPWVFTCTDFEQIPLQGEDFIYADPPYDVEFRGYAKDGFGWEDQVRLAKWLVKHPGPVVLSNQATSRIVDLYSEHGFKISYYDAPRSISCTGDRSPAKEVLATRGI